MGYCPYYCVICGYEEDNGWIDHENICDKCVWRATRAKQNDSWKELKKIFRKKGQLEFKKSLKERNLKYFEDYYGGRKKVRCNLTRKYIEEKISKSKNDIANCLKTDETFLNSLSNYSDDSDAGYDAMPEQSKYSDRIWWITRANGDGDSELQKSSPSQEPLEEQAS